MNFNNPVFVPLIATVFVHVILFITVLSFSLDEHGGGLKKMQPLAIKTRLVKSSELFTPKNNKPVKEKITKKPQVPDVKKKSSVEVSKTSSSAQESAISSLEKLPTLSKVQQKKAPQKTVAELKTAESNSSLKQLKEDDAAKLDEQSKSLEELLESVSVASTNKRSTEGGATSSEQEVIDHYLARNRSLVEQQFNVNSISQKHIFRGLEVRIKVNLNEVGKIEKAVVVQSSGNSLFDNKAINAVKRVGKFILPEDDDTTRTYFREIIMDYSIQS